MNKFIVLQKSLSRNMGIQEKIFAVRCLVVNSQISKLFLHMLDTVLNAMECKDEPTINSAHSLWRVRSMWADQKKKKKVIKKKRNCSRGQARAEVGTYQRKR